MAVLNNSALVGASGKGGAALLPQRSLRFNPADSAFLSRTFASAGNRKTWTWSGWVKRAGLYGTYQQLFGAGAGSGANDGLFFDVDSLNFFPDGASAGVKTTAVFRDASAWYHIVLAIDTTQGIATNRVKMYINGSQVTAFSVTAYPGPDAETQYINTTSQHRIGAHTNAGFYLNGYLANIHFIDGQALDASAFAYTDPATGRWEPKAYAGSYSGNSFYLDFSDNSAATATTLGADRSGLGNNWVPNNLNATAAPYFYPPSGGGGLDQYIPAGWTRTNNPSDVLANNQTGVLVNQNGALMFAIKPTSSSITIKWIVYDGSGTYTPNVVLNTSSSWSNTLIGPSSVSGNGSTGSPSVGTYSVTAGTTYYVSTYGQGNPALVVYATNVTIEPIGTSASGIDSLRDHPVSAGIDGGLGGEVSGNYCTWNPLLKSSYVTLSNGNLDSAHGGSGTHARVTGTFGLTSGKWYYEATLNAVGGQWPAVGVALADTADQNTYVGAEGGTFGYYPLGGVNGGGGGRTYSSYTTGDVIGIAIDIDSQRLTFYKNGVAAVTAGTSYETLWAGVTYVPAVSGYNGGANWTCNFGQRPWAYPGSVPAGFKALCDTNMTQPTIVKPATVMDVKLYTGNGSSQTISGFNFSPDFLWTSVRDVTGYFKYLIDSVRGSDKYLVSFNSNAEGTDSQGITSLTSSGFTVGSSAQVNENGRSMVAWAWDAGSSAAETNNSGSIISTVKVNATAGFSIVSWTSTSSPATIAHGLGVEPHLIITKGRSGQDQWVTYHKSVGATKYLYLNATDAAATYSGFWNNTAPTSTVFTTGTDAIFTTNGRTKIAYCFAAVPGLSAFGAYAGGGASGRFVHTGFRPKLVWVKAYATGSYPTVQGWYMWDSVRGTYNYNQSNLVANSNVQEGLQSDGSGIFGIGIDILSNGFCLRGSDDAATNWGSESYIYCAWAESPFKYSRAR